MSSHMGVTATIQDPFRHGPRTHKLAADVPGRDLPALLHELCRWSDLSGVRRRGCCFRPACAECQ